MEAWHTPFEPVAEQDGGEDVELDQVAVDSPNVDPADVDTLNSSLEADAVARALGQVDVLVEQLDAIPRASPLVTPLNAATQAPGKFQPMDEGTPMLSESEGEKSDYEAHFTQSIAKGDKARKLANRTPEAEGITADKLRKKQKNSSNFTNLPPLRMVFRETHGTWRPPPLGVSPGKMTTPRRTRSLLRGGPMVHLHRLSLPTPMTKGRERKRLIFHHLGSKLAQYTSSLQMNVQT
ncbi:unnamed protein product [Calypogeia fissa]